MNRIVFLGLALVGLAACDFEPPWRVLPYDPDDLTSNRFVCTDAEHGLDICAFFGPEGSDRDNRCLMYFQVTTSGPGEQPEVILQPGAEADAGVNLYRSNGKLLDWLPLNFLSKPENATLDDAHGRLIGLDETSALWFYSGMGKGDTGRDAEANVALMKSGVIEFVLPVADKKSPLHVKVSLDGFEKAWRDNLGPVCNWLDETG